MPYYFESEDGHFFQKNKNGKIKRISKELFIEKNGLNKSGGATTNLVRTLINPAKDIGKRFLGTLSGTLSTKGLPSVATTIPKKSIETTNTFSSIPTIDIKDDIPDLQKSTKIFQNQFIFPSSRHEMIPIKEKSEIKSTYKLPSVRKNRSRILNISHPNINPTTSLLGIAKSTIGPNTIVSTYKTSGLQNHNYIEIIKILDKAPEINVSKSSDEISILFNKLNIIENEINSSTNSKFKSSANSAKNALLSNIDTKIWQNGNKKVKKIIKNSIIDKKVGNIIGNNILEVTSSAIDIITMFLYGTENIVKNINKLPQTNSKMTESELEIISKRFKEETSLGYNIHIISKSLSPTKTQAEHNQIINNIVVES